MTDYKIVGTPVVTPSGMTRKISEGVDEGKVMQLVETTFTKEHPMYKTYGVTSMRAHKFPKDSGGWGDIFYTIEGDIFKGKKFEFKSDIWNRSVTMRKQTENFLQSLKRAQGYKVTKFLENLVNIAKYVR